MTPRARGPYYGYWIILAAMAIQMVVNGCGMYAFSLFVKPLEAAFGWSRAGIMMSFVVYNLALALASPWAGRLADRHGPGRVVAAGAMAMGLGLAWLATSNRPWHYHAGWGLVGAGVAAAGFVPLTAVLFRWFRRRRGLAVGMMGIGIGAGGFVIAPVIGTLLLPQLGWRAAFLALGALVPVAIVPLALLVLKSSPAELGLTPDGPASEEPGVSPTAGGGVRGGSEGGPSLGDAMRMPDFWLLAACFLAFGFAMNSFFQNHVPHLQDLGFPVAVAATGLSAVGAGSAAGKFLFGWLCDLVRARYVFVAGVLLQLAGVLVLMTVGPGSPTSKVWLYASLYGLGIGCWPVMSLVVSGSFGTAHYGAVFGALSMVWTLGGSLGAPVAGHIRDVAGSYQPAFWIFAAAFLLTIPLILVRPKEGGAKAFGSQP